jgi:predicted exporter
MVGPMSSEERSRLTLRLKIGFVLLIGFSAGLTTLVGDPTLVEVALVTLVGLVVGAVVVRVVFPGTGAVEPRRR